MVGVVVKDREKNKATYKQTTYCSKHVLLTAALAQCGHKRKKWGSCSENTAVENDFYGENYLLPARRVIRELAQMQI